MQQVSTLVHCDWCGKPATRTQAVTQFRRGLCDKCRRDRVIRLQITQPADGFHEVRPAFPTDAAPKTPRKETVMTFRAYLGQDLFHDDDGKGDRALPADKQKATARVDFCGPPTYRDYVHALLVASWATLEPDAGW